jgi:hypothetical protein
LFSKFLKRWADYLKEAGPSDYEEALRRNIDEHLDSLQPKHLQEQRGMTRVHEVRVSIPRQDRP